MNVVIHRGPLPDTGTGHHWFDLNGKRYSISGGPGPDGGNRGYAYVIEDVQGNIADEQRYTLAGVREWACEEARYT